MKVYILIREHAQESEILGVYTSHEKAQEVLDKEISLVWKYSSFHHIQEEEVL